MGYVCGWIFLFRILIGFIDRWFLWLFPTDLQVILYGVLELANGCCSLGEIADVGTRFVVAGGMLAFGGFCVAMQTASVVGDLGMKHYLKGKVMQTLFNIALCSVVALRLFSPSIFSKTLLIMCTIGIIWVLMFRKKQKNSSIPAIVGV